MPREEQCNHCSLALFSTRSAKFLGRSKGFVRVSRQWVQHALSGTNNLLSKAPRFQECLHAFAQSVWLSISLVTINQNITRGRHEVGGFPLLK